MLRKTLAAVALAFAALVATPLAANAAGYAPNSNVTVNGPVVAGGTVIVNFGPGSFAGSENVSFQVTGYGTVTLSAFKAATVTATKQATPAGAVSESVTLPTDARGTYTLTATGLTSGAIGTASLTVVPTDVAGTSPVASSGSGMLAHTGSTLPMLLIWTAGGAVALGLALFVVLGLVRRQRADA